MLCLKVSLLLLLFFHENFLAQGDELTYNPADIEEEEEEKGGSNPWKTKTKKWETTESTTTKKAPTEGKPGTATTTKALTEGKPKTTTTTKAPTEGKPKTTTTKGKPSKTTTSWKPPKTTTTKWKPSKTTTTTEATTTSAIDWPTDCTTNQSIPTEPPQRNVTCIWGSWGPCSATCNYGIWTRSLVSLTNPEVPCTPPMTQKDGCFVAPCPMDCVVSPNWQCWSPCSAACGGGYRYRSRQVVTPPLFGGAACNQSDIDQQEACNTSPCAYECRTTGEWSSWSSCSSTCGGGIQERSIAYKEGLLAMRSGPNTTCTKTAQYRFCNLSCCSTSYNCLQSDWTSWSPCSASCGSGIQYRSRRILVPSIGNGTSCGPTYEKQKCNTLSCTESSLSMLCSRRRNTFIPFGRCASDYIYCTPGGQAVFNTCPQDKAFSTSYGICVNKWMIADCAKESRASDCVGRTNGLYPLCPCCSQYLLCWEGVSTRRSCRSNEAFETSPFGRCVDRSSSPACMRKWK
ncbi:hypothetical protein M514_02163 [Trichuris suis]|uniref:Chitin-binding type-2 domain-containing protein n=1 Tax=Trichuris suis TaxID=68888 RepID=A0A085MI60_9BILA|nr:hypothetical protein M513_02163 [Trichuris suis]KFD66145.1 hypothetical protein M514_02163 [Trichuris suis]